MIFNYPQPSGMSFSRVQINKPQIVSHSTTGKPSNVYRIQLNHTDPVETNTRNYEVWATKEAIQQHFMGQDITPYHVKKFARQMYENRLNNTGGKPRETGLFVSTTQKVHGDPSMWPQSIADTEIKS